jgi:predicted ATPase
MSDGVLRALGAFVAAFQAGPAPLIGIEEAESGLHPAAAEVLFAALSEATAIRQTLVTSHTTVFLDSAAVEQESILAVVADGGSTYAGPIEAVGKDALRKRLTMPGELLPVDGLRTEKNRPADDSARQLFLGDEAEAES